MFSIEKRPRQDGRASWRHYRTPSGEQRNKTFDRKADAERFLADVESVQERRVLRRLVLAPVTVGEWATPGSTARPTSSRRPPSGTPGILRHDIVPHWGSVRLSRTSRTPTCRRVPLSRTRSPATVREVHRVLTDPRPGRPTAGWPATWPRRSTCSRACPPRAAPPQHPADRGARRGVRPPFGVQQAPPLRRAGVRGLPARRPVPGLHRRPFGEMAALRSAAWTSSAAGGDRGVGHRGAGGSWSGALRRHTSAVRCRSPGSSPRSSRSTSRGRAAEDLVFTVQGAAARCAPRLPPGHFDAAATAIGIPGLHPHELRHTAASLAISAGADVVSMTLLFGTPRRDDPGHLWAPLR